MTSPIPWHARALDDALKRWEANPTRGLEPELVATRRAKLGDNSLPTEEPPSALRQLLSQLADPLVGALLVAALVSMGVALTSGGEGSLLLRFGDTFAILLIVIVNALLGFFQERRAERALEALQKMAAPNATVIRAGKKTVVPARELVPGDLIELVAGDSVPADVRLIETHEMATEEAALTGESTPVAKHGTTRHADDAPLAERSNMVYLGTTVVRGRAKGVVVATGAYTELGRIGTLMRSVEEVDTPLERRLDRLGKIILAICLALSVVLFLLGVAMGGRSWTVMLLTAVSLAVAAIPEGLPAITTITLALGMQRMAHRGAIVRKLPAVETLGSATIICSDKTGTLTQNQMTVRAVETFEHAYRVEGDGYVSDGHVMDDDGPVTAPNRALRALAEVAAICNDASFEEADGKRKVLGDPTEGALLVLAEKLGVHRDTVLAQKTIEATRPFDGDRKRMSVVADRVAYVKGSPDSLVERCTHALTEDGPVPLDDAGRARLHERNEAYAKQALRVLAFATREDPDPSAIETNLVFVGLAAMIDPPRPEVKTAIAECAQAGIRVVMITGDHALTATAIAKELGLWTDTSIAMTGTELAGLSEQELDARLDDVAVFARTTAEQKLRLVRALQRRGEVAAMTGDGVNDAPALREAHIGVAMGLAGTDVARDAAEMVLADDNFATIVHAVREGRAIFRNIQKFIFFLNSSNAGLVVAVIVGSFFDWMPQLTPLQLLWVNLVTNGLPALALGVDPPDPSQMEEKPRDPGEGIVGGRDFVGMLLVGVVMGGAALGLMWLPELAPGLIGGATRAETLDRCRAMAFTLLAVSPLFHAFNCRSRWRSAFSRPFENRALWAAIGVSFAVHAVTILVPGLHEVFRTHLLTATEWGIVLGLAALPIPVFELIKAVARAGRQSR
ncbi:MAG: calcium-translocating P-type ATPase, SERCA-type [Sandaracinaceae bacterium]|nr:calcium-translocating P-type ATPase, SERCA-type [Sandaracinaceae bacterium]